MVLWLILTIIFIFTYYLYRYCRLTRSIRVSDKFNIKNSKAIIIGGSEGIGKAIAIELVKEGASVTIAARRENILSQTVKELNEYILNPSQKVSYLVFDVTEDYEIIQNKINTIIEHTGPFNLLINCAGFADMRAFEDLPMTQIEKMINCNLIGSIKSTKAIIPSMIKQKFGHIVFLNSVCGQFSFYGCTGYSASKFGLRGFSDAIAMELKQYNIGVTVIFPPDTDTPGYFQEMLTKPNIVKHISESNSLYSSEQIAQKAVKSISNRSFWCCYGFNGFFINLLTQGCSPIFDILSIFTSIFYVIIKSSFIITLSGFYNTIQNYYEIDSNKNIKKKDF